MTTNYMEEAIKEAKKAYDSGEVPVGCVIVKNKQIIARAHNMTESTNDATGHAELLAIKSALKAEKKKYLEECEIYVTLEPCAMCAGAIINTRIKRLYIGAPEPKTGCCGSVVNLFSEVSGNTEVYIGMSEDRCKHLLKDFFKSKR